MPTVQLGNIAADMRLVNDSYGIAALQAFNDFVFGFVPVREELVSAGPSSAVVRQYDAANDYITITVYGDLLAGQVSQLAIEAAGVIESVYGIFTVNTTTLDVYGTATQVDVRLAAGNALLVSYSGLAVAVNNDIPEPPADDVLLAGADQVSAGSEAQYLLGYAGNDTLSGGPGNDTLDGGAGADSMLGGTGDDLYFVNDAADQVVEYFNEGVDEVRSTVSHTLASYVDNLLLLGAAGISGTGDSAPNAITGNAGANVLDGAGGDDRLAGAAGNDFLRGGEGNDRMVDGANSRDTLDGGPGIDTMQGGLGNDTYFVDNSSDVVVESSDALNGGIDLVKASVTRKLANFQEHLTLTGTAAINGTGNGLDNKITGNSGVNILNGGVGADTLIGGFGNDRLFGKAGSDTLTGNGGADRFYFDTAPGIGNIDLITDFASGADKIVLDDDVFSTIGAPGALSPANFAIDPIFLAVYPPPEAHLIVYRTATGSLSYLESDGLGALSDTQFATLGTASHPAITAADFQIVG